MKAFLSHSSADKHFVGQVAAELGDNQIEYDERTFEFVLNVKAIREALGRSDLFVYFLSSKSITSSFVSEEQKVALERLGAGTIKKVIVFALDDTTYHALPAWMRDVNVVTRLTTPKACARRIQSILVELEAADDGASEIYIPRTAEESALQKALSGPPAETPIALHAVGHFGVGRKTFFRKNLHRLFPRRFSTFPEITIGLNQGIEELYRQLFELTQNSSLENTLRQLSSFADFSANGKVDAVSRLLQELSDGGEFLFVTDDGGVYGEDGNYQPHIKQVIERVNGRGLPVIGFIQTRMMPVKFKEDNPRSFHVYIATFSEDVSKELLGLLLKQLDVDYSASQLNDVNEHLDGHPFNIRFSAVFAHDYGLENLIADPSDLISWKRRRAEDFLGRMVFDAVESDLAAALNEYRYLAPEMLFSVFDYKLMASATALRRLQEFSCVERREGYYHIAPPIREAIRRDDRFRRSDRWKQEVGRKICESIGDYSNEDQVSISILDSGALAAARGVSAPPFLSTLILPSHLLRIAREYYDGSKWVLCMEFCSKAWLAKDRLPGEAQLEVLRLWALSSIRTTDSKKYQEILELLHGMSGRTAERISLFVEGFYFRVHKELDKAELKFMAAWRISKQNQSVNRELASILSKQRRYDEAEKFARGPYEQAPTNPYLIDALVEILLGKLQQGLPVDQTELRQIMKDFERYGDAPGSSFYLVRKAQAELASRQLTDALSTINRAVERTPGLLSAYFIRADIRIALKDLDRASEDITQINHLLESAGGFSEGDEARLEELEIRF